MREIILAYLPWLISAGTISATWLIGSKWRWCWHLALVTQGLWFVWIITSGTWGLLPTAICLSTIHIRNIIKWQREGGREDGPAPALNS
jgi:hypothetical protein